MSFIKTTTRLIVLNIAISVGIMAAGHLFFYYFG